MNIKLFNRITILCLAVISFTIIACSKEKEPIRNNNKEIKGFVNTYHFDLSNPVLNRNFYALAKVRDNTAAAEILKSNETLERLGTTMLTKFRSALSKQDITVNELGLNLKFTDAQIVSIMDQVANSANASQVQAIVTEHLKPSGAYQIYVDNTDKEILKYAVRECLKGINKIIDVYTQNMVPLDEISDLGLYHETKNTYKSSYAAALKSAALSMNGSLKEKELFFEPSLQFALLLLKINNREEAGAFQPLETGENLKALNYIKDINWDNYPYASMLLLGDSPNSAGDDINISNSAKVRVKNAVDNLNAGLAPLVIISGSNVYPNLTPYFEAIEMKKYMMTTYGIDEKKIIVDPNARHTTSNVRNASRFIFRYKIPHLKKSIITGTESHINTIIDPAFAKRCNNYFGFMPATLGQRVSTHTLEFTPVVKSLNMQPSIDPLDP